MFPYQLSKILAEQHIHDMVAARERHDRIAAASRHEQSRTERPSLLKVVTAQIRQAVAQLHGARSVHAPSTATSLSDPGPMGCSA